MSNLRKIQTIIKSNKKYLEKKYQLKSIGIFGSYLRNQQKKSSDLDILVEFKQPVSLLKFVSLELELSRLLGMKIDLVMKSALKPRIGRHILKEVVYL